MGKSNYYRVMEKKNQTLVQAIKFVLFSASAGIIQAGVFALLHDALKAFVAAYWPNYLIALICSIVWNFTINRKFNFKDAVNIPKAMLIIFGYYCVFTPLSTWAGKVLEGNVNHYVLLIGTMVVNMVTEFCVYKFIVFRRKEG